MSAPSRNQVKGQIAKQARARARWHIVRDCSDEGLSKTDAARRAGLTIGGLEALLYRETGSCRWPIV